MKYRLIIKTKKDEIIKEDYNTKKAVEFRFDCLLKDMDNNMVKCVWISPINKPEERRRIDF